LFEEEMIFIRASYQELLKNNKRKEWYNETGLEWC
jgi:hypothetical protein